jgi:hypothetical protein
MWKIYVPAHFPIITKHYDELIYHYFLTTPLAPTFDPILPWWTTAVLVRTSMLVFLVLALRKLGVSMLLAVLSVCFMYFGSFSFNPAKIYLLFDSGNPLYYVGHAGRIVGVGAGILLFVDLFARASGKRGLPVMALILVGLGLTATSYSNAFWLFLIYAWAMLSIIYYRHKCGDGL